MKLQFACEICNKIYESEQEALACEETHRAEKIRAQEREKIDRNLTEAINQYIETYGTFPDLRISKNNMRVLLKELRSVDMRLPWIGDIEKLGGKKLEDTLRLLEEVINYDFHS